MISPKIIKESNKKLILFLSDELLPKDSSLPKLKSILREFKVLEKIIVLPDINFKVKNYIPSGIVVPLKDEFSYYLLGPNNDGIGMLKVRTNKEFLRDQVIEIFNELKRRIALFRRKEDKIDDLSAKEILSNGINNIIEEFGFSRRELKNIEDKGCNPVKDALLLEVIKYSAKSRPKTLPDFVPNTDLIDRAKKTIGVLDGTSHFIEFYKIGKIYDKSHIDIINLKPSDYLFMVHAGGGDVSIVLHRIFLERLRKYNKNNSISQLALESIKVAENFGFSNRLFIFNEIKKTVKKFIKHDCEFEILFDAPHDLLEVKNNSIFVHRKGAVKLIPKEKWKEEGNFGKVYAFPTYPGGKAYLLWKKSNNNLSQNYISHGAGRMIRKDKAIQQFNDNSAEAIIRKNILLFRYGFDQISGQHPSTFKDEKKVIQTIKEFELADISAELIPIASLKT